MNISESKGKFVYIKLENDLRTNILNGKFVPEFPLPCDEMAGYMATYLAQLAIRSLDFKQTIPVPLEMITPVFI